MCAVLGTAIDNILYIHFRINAVFWSFYVNSSNESDEYSMFKLLSTNESTLTTKTD